MLGRNCYVSFSFWPVAKSLRTLLLAISSRNQTFFRDSWGTPVPQESFPHQMEVHKYARDDFHLYANATGVPAMPKPLPAKFKRITSLFTVTYGASCFYSFLEGISNPRDTIKTFNTLACPFSATHVFPNEYEIRRPLLNVLTIPCRLLRRS